MKYPKSEYFLHLYTIYNQNLNIHAIPIFYASSSGPLSFTPNDFAIRKISPNIPEAVFAESDSGP